MHSQPAWQQQQQHGCRLPEPLQQFISKQRATRLQQQQEGPGRAAGFLEGSSSCHRSSGSSGCGVLLVDFGSMGCLGLLKNAALLLQVLLQALRPLNW
jgi:hypothetical protein